MANAAGAMGSGIQSVGKAVSLYAEAQQREQDFELERKIVDFKLDTEMEYERYKREMPPGAEGYGNAWTDRYRERAKAFVGENYANVPERLRPQVDARLQKHDVVLRERAIRDEYGERDRKTVENLENTLGKTRSAVEANPDRLDELHDQGKTLIEGSLLPPTLRSQYAKKYRVEMEEAAATSIVDRITDAETYNRAKELLAPHKAERVTAKGVAAEIRREADGMSVIQTGSGAKFRVSSDHSTRFQGLISDLEQLGIDIKPDQSGGYANRNIRGSNTPSQHSFGKAIDLNWNENGVGSRGAIVDQLGEEKIRELAAKHGLKWGGDFKGGRRDPMHFEVDGSATPSAAPPVAQRSMTAFAGLPGKGAEPTAVEAYDGPFQNLSLAKRRAIWGKAEAQMEKMKSGVEKMIKEHEEGAMNGRLPTDAELNAIESRVRALKEPVLAAKYDALLEKAGFSRGFLKLPPQAGEAYVADLERMAAERGTSKALEDRIQFARKSLATMAKHVNEDPMGHAAKTGISIQFAAPAGTSFEQAEAAGARAPLQLERLDFNSPNLSETLGYRMEQAKAVGGYYGQPAQVFTKLERDGLKDALRQGGKPLLAVLGHISNAATAAGLEASDVVKEFSKDAPELSVIGQMVVNRADPRILETAATALSWRAKQGEKFVSTIDKAQSKPDLGEYADVLAATPMNVDAVKHTANIIYEYEARRAGKQDFDNTLYTTVVKRLMGQTETPDGKSYGGVGRQGTGWSDGKWGSNGWFGSTPKVMVPPEVRTDSFDDLVGSIRHSDLAEKPVDASGKPLTIGQIRQASWVSVGPGRYALELKRDADGTRVVAMGAAGTPYVLDVRSILPTIRKRKPEIFMGYDGTQKAVIEPEN